MSNEKDLLSKDAQGYLNSMKSGYPVFAIARPGKDYSTLAGIQYWATKQRPAKEERLILYGPDTSEAQIARAIHLSDDLPMLEALLSELRHPAKPGLPTISLKGQDLKEHREVTIEFSIQDFNDQRRLIHILQAYIAYLKNGKTASS